MGAARWDLYIEPGYDFDAEYQWTDSAGAPINLTGFTGKAEVRARRRRSTEDETAYRFAVPALLTFVTSPGVGEASIVVNSGGIIRLVAPEAITRPLVWRNPAAFDLGLASSGGASTLFMAGAAVLRTRVAAFP